jgi:hypothetical protein
MARKSLVLSLLVFSAIVVASCATAIPTATHEAVRPTKPSAPTPVEPAPTPAVQVEARQVELEWPSSLRLGESDVVRLALIPSSQGYIAQA